MTEARRYAAAVAGLIVVGLAVVGAPIATTTERASAETPVTVVPPLPEQLNPLTKAISPVTWQACRGVGLAIGLTAVAGTLAGVPAEVSEPVNNGVSLASGPALSAFFELCQQIPLPDTPPDCETDALVPPLPTLGRPIPPAALLASELRALGDQFVEAGVALGATLGDAADDLLACTHGKNPEPDDAGDDPTPSSDGGMRFAPGARGDTVRPIPALSDVTALAGEGFPGAPRALGGNLPIAQPIRASTEPQGRGVAIAFGLVSVLAGLGWVHAGGARRRSSASQAVS